MGQAVYRFLLDESGQSMVEYSFVLALIAATAVLVLKQVGLEIVSGFLDPVLGAFGIER